MVGDVIGGPSRRLAVAGAAAFAWSAAVTADVINVPGDQGTIQAAIDVAADGDEIVVAPGTYVENLDLGGKAITVRSTAPSDPAVVVATIIDGGAAGSVITCDDGETATTVISGFVITNGAGSFGGGLRNLGSSPTVMNCSFSANMAVNDGGAIFNDASSPNVRNCTFDGNAAAFGGAITNRNGSKPSVSDSVFVGNTAGDQGGAMLNQNSEPVLTRCVFEGNEAMTDGGAIHSFFSAPTFDQCVIRANVAGDDGGGSFSFGLAPTMIECIVCRNVPDQVAGLIDDGGGNIIGNHCPPPNLVPTVLNANDACADAAVVADGNTAFNTAFATTDGPELPVECDEGAGIGFDADLWFAYTPTCNGTALVSTCGQAGFDTRLAAYAGPCDELELIACNDEGPKCGGGTSEMELAVEGGRTIYIRLGGLDGAQGSGVVSITCVGTLCAADVDRDGDVDFQDLLILLRDFGGC